MKLHVPYTGPPCNRERFRACNCCVTGCRWRLSAEIIQRKLKLAVRLSSRWRRDPASEAPPCYRAQQCVAAASHRSSLSTPATYQRLVVRHAQCRGTPCCAEHATASKTKSDTVHECSPKSVQQESGIPCMHMSSIVRVPGELSILSQENSTDFWVKKQLNNGCVRPGPSGS